ncbi:MAG TPA: hypothetical protein VF749_08980 [Candidatus Acidoferrum sp.]
MAATWLYRVASIVFVLFALGHTYGFLSFRPSSAEGQAVYESMNRVHLADSGRGYTYGGFYRGFGLSATVSMLFWAYLCWYLGELARTNPAAIGTLGWAFLAVQIAGAVLSFLYFGPPPMVLSLLVALLVGLAAWLARSQQQTGRHICS